MIEALPLRAHACARHLFNALNVMAILAWLVGAATALEFLHRMEGGDPMGRAVSDTTGRQTAVLVFVGFFTVGMVLLSIAQAIRYFASIAEAAGRLAAAHEGRGEWGPREGSGG